MSSLAYSIIVDVVWNVVSKSGNVNSHINRTRELLLCTQLSYSVAPFPVILSDR